MDKIIDKMKEKKVSVLFFVCIVFVCILAFYFFVSAPSSYPVGTVISIEPGESLSKVTVDFRNKGIIRSSTSFQIFAILFGAERKTIAGDYLLKQPENVFRLAWRISRGLFGMAEIKVTIPEGFTVAQISDLLGRKLVDSRISHFSAVQFMLFAKNDEGYLFPDTYFFSPTATSSVIVNRMKDNFQAHVIRLKNRISTSGYTQAEIVTMASIVEGEATSTRDREIVAGILWARLKAGIALQVDSTLKYVTGRGSKDLTFTDLHNLSPYNTYTHLGLPPAPINNPGLDSLSAVLDPIQTDYVYFLTGKDGVMHYAKTFEDHKKNIQKYL